jgi:hypothetical protein
MSAARSVTATFVLQHTLTVTRAGSGSGTVASAPSGVSCGSTCASDYDDGAEVTLTAAAAAGSRFAGWAGAECSGTGTCTVTMSAARSVSAAFVPLHALSIAKAGSGSGDVAGAGIDCGSTCAADYDEDTEVTLLATASTGSRFAGWSGAGCSGSGAGTCTVTMTAARSVTATFVAVHPLAVAKSGSGDGTVAGDGIDCGAACSAEYDEGSEIRLTATPAAGSRFTGWSGAGCSGTGACTVTMAAARAVTAGFVTVHPLSVTRSGSGTGAVTGDGIDCGSTCGAEYVEGTIVTLTATAAPGSRFAGWTGAGCAGTGTCTLSFGGARAVTAEFVALHSLSVTKIGSGAGTVTSDVGSLLCGPTCSADYDDGTSVTLTAVPAAGSRFAGWSGAGCAGTGTCTVTLGAARSVTAELVALHTLTLTKTGSGSGTVAGSGLDCGPTCAATFDEGTVLTLTATAAAGSSFTGWSGAGCSGTGICTVTMNTARTVGAEFTVDAAPPPPARHALTVTKGGSGDGLVAGLGTDCGATCASTFDDGAVVVLHAKAARGSRLGGWSGEDCSGTETCTVAMTAARHVTATFVRLVPLRVSVRGRGRVAATTPGIDCAPSCSATYDANELVTLVARPRPGHWLAAWSGDCAGRAERCTVTLDQARRVRARFAPNLELALATTARLVYHLPYERARVEARATWQGRPVSGAAVRVSILCRGRHLVRVLRTDRHGRAAFRWGTVLPNRVRVLRCVVDARVAVNGRTANADRRSVGFIHPLWLEVTRWKGRSPVVRIWGRPGEAVVLLRNGDIVAETRIGSRGWIDVSSPRIRRGDGLHARGENHHHSHVIGA